MTKFKKWLYNRFLPAWCKDDLMEKNEELTRLAREQRQEIERLRAYIDGMHLALKRLPHVYREARRE